MVIVHTQLGNRTLWLSKEIQGQFKEHANDSNRI